MSSRLSRADATRRTSSSDAGGGSFDGGGGGATSSSPAPPGETEFIRECRAAYFCFVDSLDEDLKDKKQLALVLQHAGRNPSNKTIDKSGNPIVVSGLKCWHLN